MSAIEKLEKRLAELEAEVAKLKERNGKTPSDDRPWWEKIYGSFEGDPHYKEAMELGRKYRESFRPKPRKKKKEAEQEMIILDSDYLSLLEWPEGDSARKILHALKSFDSEDVATTIVNFEEQMHGWIQAIRGHKEIRDQVEKYRRMRRSLRNYCSLNVLDFDEVAATEFQRLRKQYRRLGAMDLKIAAIVVAHRATLWTRNMQHFGQIAGLDAVDITKE